jgi:hypothetical protein
MLSMKRSRESVRQWLIEFRCWLLFRHWMKSIGNVPLSPQTPAHRCIIYQCEICAKTISVSQKDLSWL